MNRMDDADGAVSCWLRCNNPDLSTFPSYFLDRRHESNCDMLCLLQQNLAESRHESGKWSGVARKMIMALFLKHSYDILVY
jgi:hypothetical protein